MDEYWLREFRQRITDFCARTGGRTNAAVSVKVRVTSGCFHREHSPEAYRIIDRYLSTHPVDESREEFAEHESGPEIIVYLAVATAGLSLAKSVVDLVTTILKARSEGIKKGDDRTAALEVIVRGYQNGEEFYQESVLRIEHSMPVTPEVIEQAINQATKALPAPNTEQEQSDSKRKRKTKKK